MESEHKPACAIGVVAIPGLCPNCGSEVEIEMKNCPECEHSPRQSCAVT